MSAKWVPVDVAHPCGREAIGQAAKGMHWSDLRRVLSGCSCMKLGEASIEQVTAAAAGVRGVIERIKWFQEGLDRVKMPTSDQFPVLSSKQLF